jgi:hypothetical protein
MNKTIKNHTRLTFNAFCILIAASLTQAEEALPTAAVNLKLKFQENVFKATKPLQDGYIKSLEILLKSPDLKNKPDAIFAIKNEIDLVKQNKNLFSRNTSEINCDRMLLDKKLRFVGHHSNVDPKDPLGFTDPNIASANMGNYPNLIRNGDLIFAEKLMGESMVLFGAPLSPNMPGFIDFSDAIKNQQGMLIIKIRNWPTGDINATFIVDDKEIDSLKLNNNQWKTFALKLNNQNVKVKINANGNWWFENCLFTYDILN